MPSFDPLFAFLHKTDTLCKMKEFSKKELTRYNGKNGAPAYIAYNSKVYDVSVSFVWRNGDHQFRHQAGQDLTGGLRQAPHGEDLLERVVLIGTLRED